MKGIILSGGKGTRLYPATIATSKQLLPVYNKPMIYYPLSTLISAGIKDILIITTTEDKHSYIKLLGDGSQLGISISYETQDQPRGLADAFIVGSDFLSNQDDVCLILGDNIFYGNEVEFSLMNAIDRAYDGVASIFTYRVTDPRRYGIAELDAFDNVVSVEEKPAVPKSNNAIVGLYTFDNQVVDIAHKLKPSSRGELEITDIINKYLKNNSLEAYRLPKGVAWFDAGTHESLLQASNFIQAIEERQGLLVGSPGEVAYKRGLISKEQFAHIAYSYSNEYGKKLQYLAGGLSE